MDCEVTLYEESWRLGGKGASGRGSNGRIEEHGLHLWLGYYENAFRMVREAYAERAAAGHPSPAIDDVFEPLPGIGLFTEVGSAPWDWLGTFPVESGAPGDGTPLAGVADAAHLGPRVARLLAHLLQSVAPGPLDGATFSSAVRDLLDLLAVEPLSQVERQIPESQLLPRVATLREAIRPLLEQLPFLGPRARLLAELIDIVLATTIGFFRERLEANWYERMNHFDFREWLQGEDLVFPSSVGSPFLASLYNLAFAYESGDPARPRIAAGVALECAIRTFLTYKSAPFWRMNAGMGDVVFAPLYLALRNRGVRIKFFHALQRVGWESFPRRGSAGEPLSAGRIGGLVFRNERPALLDYQPLIDVRGVPCWPSQPLIQPEAQPGDGTNTDVSLAAGSDFDHAILAVGWETFAGLAGDLFAADQRWAAVAQSSRTVATQSVQLWLRPRMHDLGGSLPPVAMTGLAPGLDTFADMSHLAVHEDWEEPPGSILYFCGTVHETETAPAAERARRDVESLFADGLRRVVPAAFDGHRLRAGLSAVGDQPAIFGSLNATGSARYSQSPPGSISSRVSPLDDSFENLAVAGDWTDCGLNVGCVEAAVTSGILAAGAVTGHVDASRLYGHGFLRPWFRERRPVPPPPVAESELDARLLQHAALLNAAVDDALDDFDADRFSAAMRAAEPLRYAGWATDSVPVIQAGARPGERQVVPTELFLAGANGAGSFTAEWLAPPGSVPGTVEIHAGSRGILEIELKAPLANGNGRAWHHVLVRASNGQAVLLVELVP
jgi:uncharacterized protein with NAD-binding domain and iron-sulfur cluster